MTPLSPSLPQSRGARWVQQQQHGWGGSHHTPKAQCHCSNPLRSPQPPLFFLVLNEQKFFPLRISGQRNGAKHFSFIIIMPVKRTP